MIGESRGKYILRNALGEVVETYNRLHGIEAKARVVEIRDDGSVIIEFTGTFCHTCGVRDWVEDLAYLAKSMGYDAELLEYIEPDGEEWYYKRLGVFAFRLGLPTKGDENDNGQTQETG